MIVYKVVNKFKHAFNPEKLRGGMVSITFDDQWHSAYSNALPLLDKYGFKSTWYVCFSNIGKYDSEYNERSMDFDELHDLKNRGHEIASHTMTHCDFDLVGIDLIADELKESRSKLMLEFRCPVTNFAYPFTRTGVLLGGPQAAMRHFRSARGGEFGLNSYPFRRQSLYACKLYKGRHSLEYYKALVDVCISGNKWLIFYTHDVKHNCTDYGCTPIIFENLLKYLSEVNVEIDTVNGIMR